MARPEKLLERMRATDSEWSQADFCAVLDHFGFEFIRHVRHGAMYRHPLLAKHPDETVRRELAQVVIPKGTSLRDWVAHEVLSRVDFLQTYQQELGDGG